MPATWKPTALLNEVFANLSITTSEDTVIIASDPVAYGGTPPGRPEPTIQMRSDQAWLYSHKTAGPYYPVAANEVFNFRCMNPTFPGTTLYVKAASASGTLYGLRVQ